MPTSVFFSYARADQKPARAIIAALEGAGYAVWWDGLLGGGERFADTTAAALDGASAVVVLWSKTSIGSHWVHDEATVGRDRRRLVPLSLDGSEPPLGFRQFQTIDISGPRSRPGSREMQQMVAAVAALHDAAPTPKPVPPPRGLRVGRRSLIIGAGAVSLAGAGALAWRSGLLTLPSAKPNTVAVLPFANMSGVTAQNYFAEGLSAEVRALLARNDVLRVVGQTSSEVFRDNTQDAKAIARKLSVAFLLDGNVRVSGDRVRVSTELVDGRTGFSRWSKSFDRALDDVFAVQSEIASQVASALTREMGQPESAVRTVGTTNVSAFDSYLRGRADFALAESEATDRSALARFEDALSADPGFAAAQAARSRTLAAIANQYATGVPRRALYEEAISAARRAAELAPELADAHSALGYAIANGRLDIRAARAPYDRSYALGRGDPEVLGRYALFCAHDRRFELAEATIRLAAELDPLNPRTLWSIAYILYGAKRFREMFEPARRALELSPKMGSVHAYIGYAQLMMDQLVEAEQSLRKEPSSLLRLPGEAILAHRRGDVTSARRLLSNLVATHGDNGLYQQAQVLAQWGDANGAIDALQRARAVGDSGMVLAGDDPMLDPLRNLTPFSNLLRQLGFA